MSIVDKTIDKTFDDVNTTIDYELEETNSVGTSVAKDVSGIGYGAIARALIEDERGNSFDREVKRREREEREAMIEKQKKSSFEEAVQAKEGDIQTKIDQKGLRTIKQRDRELTR